MVNAIEAFDAKHMKPADEIPAFRPGDTVDVNVKIQEGNNSRIQTFTGVVIGRQGAGVRETFIVRKISFGTGVERASRCTPRPSTRSRSFVVAAFAAPSCTTCAICVARQLASSSAATTPPSEFRHNGLVKAGFRVRARLLLLRADMRRSAAESSMRAGDLSAMEHLL